MNAVSTISVPPSRRISSALLGAEPFRLFFPAGTLAGLAGVALWPLYFAGALESYPGQSHAHIMANGLFGSFILGFLGTAMPRMLSVPRFSFRETLALLLLQCGAVMCYAMGQLAWGHALFLLLLLSFIACVAVRVPRRQDIPPPGFVLVAMALACVIAGTTLALIGSFRELEPQTTALQRLLSYQGFVLLPILGIGPFLLPRFFGMSSTHDFPESLRAPKSWWRKASFAFAAGALIIVSFFLECAGLYRTAYALRFLVTAAYFLFQMPLHRAPKSSNAIGAAVRVALFGIVLGFLTVAILPQYRVGLLHLTLVGGFAVMTFTVATRVVFGHSGNLELLKRRNLWLLISIGLMLSGMATRITGDFVPRILPSHYTYGALMWIAGVLLWAVFVLPKTLVADEEG
jgi:uncharacterized protein involved in response to NO